MVLRAALADAVRWGRLVRNVADSASPPRKGATKAKSMATWSAAELQRFLDRVKDDRLFAAYRLAATTGMRRGEVLGLPWRDVDLDKGPLAVTQTLIVVDYKVQFSTSKTNKGRRSVALDPATVAALKDHKELQQLELHALGAANEHGLVFSTEDGGWLNPKAFTEAFYRRVKAAGVPRIRLHDLRHTWATLALQTGIHPNVVSEILGHSSIAITLDTYSHTIPTMQETAVDLVAALVTEAVQP